jgi:hypothetical protein
MQIQMVINGCPSQVQPIPEHYMISGWQFWTVSLVAIVALILMMSLPVFLRRGSRLWPAVRLLLKHLDRPSGGPKGNVEIYPPDYPRRASFAFAAGFVAAVYALLTTVFGFRTFGYNSIQGLLGTSLGYWRALFLAVWIVFPPIWFFIEYSSVLPGIAATSSLSFDRFKYGQDLSCKVWLAIVTLLFGLYFGKDFGLK